MTLIPQNNDERSGFVKIMNVHQYIQFGVGFVFFFNQFNKLIFHFLVLFINKDWKFIKSIHHWYVSVHYVKRLKKTRFPSEKIINYAQEMGQLKSSMQTLTFFNTTYNK